MQKALKGTQDPHEPQGSVRRRVAGEPSLPLFRQGRRRRGSPRHRRPVPRHRRGRDRPRARPPRLPEAGRRSGDGRADRRHREEPQGVDRRRDLRVHADVPGLRQDRARRGLRGDRRVVRDAGARREVARRPLPEGPRHAGQVAGNSDAEADTRRYPRAAALRGHSRRLAQAGHRAQAGAARVGRPAGDVGVREPRDHDLPGRGDVPRRESITTPEKIQEELDVYNRILPDEGQLGGDAARRDHRRGADRDARSSGWWGCRITCGWSSAASASRPSSIPSSSRPTSWRRCST